MDEIEEEQARWRLHREQRMRSESPVLPPDTSLLAIQEFVPPGFTQGIEILNDNTTHMKFVIALLMSVMGQSEEEATRTMLEIHRKGGALLPTSSFAEAQRIAAEIAAQAAKQGYP